MSEIDDQTRRSGDGKINWQAIAVFLSAIMAATAFGKTWILNDYRLEQLEKKFEQLDTKVQRIDSNLTQLNTTYHLLIDQAREHGWNIPWMPRRGR